MPGDAEDFQQQVYAVITAVPWGKVVTYGQVAALAGKPGHHRAVARALRVCPEHVDIPWYRVLSKAGRGRARIGIPDPEGAARQRAHLRAEGVGVDEDDRVSLVRDGWLPV